MFYQVSSDQGEIHFENLLSINIGAESKAYDWNLLKEQRIINDKIGEKPIVLAVSTDDQSFVAFERPSVEEKFTIRNDTLFSIGMTFDFSGRDLINSSGGLKRIKAYQEFWHSWQTFHLNTQKYQ